MTPRAPLNAASERAFLIHYARVMLAEAARRRHQPSFHALLLQWAANARKRASAGLQRGLFG